MSVRQTMMGRYKTCRRPFLTAKDPDDSLQVQSWQCSEPSNEHNHAAVEVKSHDRAPTGHVCNRYTRIVLDFGHTNHNLQHDRYRS